MVVRNEEIDKRVKKKKGDEDLTVRDGMSGIVLCSYTRFYRRRIILNIHMEDEMRGFYPRSSSTPIMVLLCVDGTT